MNDDDAERIARRMMAIRRDMGEGVQEIVHGAQTIADWRYYVRRYPWACVSGALALGVLAAPVKRSARTDQKVRQAAETLNVAAGGKPGLLMRGAQLAAPIIARNVATFVARRFAGEGAAHAAPPAEIHD